MTIRTNGKTMASKLRKLAIASTMFALVAGISSTAKAQDERGERSKLSAPIEGSWVYEVTGINGSYSFTAVASFAAGGVWLATGSNDRIVPVSLLVGSWKRKGFNRFNATADFFSFDSAGKPIGMNHIVQAYELRSPDELVGVGEFWTCDVHGKDCQRAPQIDFTVAATRIIPEDLTERSLPPE